MKTAPLASLVVTLLASAMAMRYAPRVAASTGLQRCQSADGAVVYTDQACGALGAAALPVSGPLRMRIAADHDNDVAATHRPPGLVADAPQTAPIHAGARRSMTSGCAQSTTQLTMDLQASVALGNVNRIAESYHWVGMSNRAGQRTMARLESLTAQPLVDVRFFDATVSSGLSDFADASQTLDSVTSAGGVMQLSLGTATASRVVDFAVQQYHGCYFIRF